MSVTINGVGAGDAATLVGFLASLNWSVSVVDDSGYGVDLHELHAGVEPYSVTFQKPSFERGIGFIATKAFAGWLSSSPVAEGVVRVASSTVPFHTMGFVVCSWDDVQPSEIVPALKSPRDLARSIGAVSLLPQDIRPFLLSDTKNVPWGDLAFGAWVSVAFRTIARSMAAEVEAGRLTFIGPPRLVVDVDENWSPNDLGSDGFVALQEAARWVYELDRESEVRHRLFTHEFARVADRGHGLAKMLAESCALAFDGARIAYQYGLHEQSKDAIKNLGELRKAVVDETAKIAETARQLALSTAGALFYGLGLLAGKITTSISPWVLDAMGTLGALYLVSIVGTNARFLSQQRALRATWRQKLYRYLTVSEYRELVTVPISSAELSLSIVLWSAVVLGGIMLVCVLLNDHSDIFVHLLTPSTSAK